MCTKYFVHLLLVVGIPALVVVGTPALVVVGTPALVVVGTPALVVVGTPVLVVVGTPVKVWRLRGLLGQAAASPQTRSGQSLPQIPR